MAEQLSAKVAIVTGASSNAIVYVVTQAPHINVNEILVRPTAQEA